MTSSTTVNTTGGAANSSLASSAPTTKIDVGILLLVNNEPVALRPIDEYGKLQNAVVLAKLDGKKYELTKPIKVGSLKDFNTFLQKYGASMPASGDFPAPLDEVYRKLTSLELTVEEFMVNIPGTHKLKAAAKDKPRAELTSTDIDPIPADEKGLTTYVLAVTVQWLSGEEVDLIKGTLAIQGFYCKISRV
ncbi:MULTISPECIES: hypothetical protein [Leptolyngbya]|uniref:hypothetical protein n=1 Tax=Leptolyngbya TaxID=47251 RepID=UPI001684A3BD|nr:hypothetical protein [Leptolyngbya sp. FACHB-1624]MBD1857654.1 hypothetical protein [Leptolyngbya sp. FACHB-1624]